MVLDLNPVLRGERRKIDFDFSFVPDGMPDDLNNVTASVVGTVEDHSGYMSLKADVTVKADAVCGRCGDVFNYRHTFHLESGVSKDSVGEEKEDEYLIAPDGMLDLGEAANSFLILSLPYRFLCSSECKGLCQICGKNLNEGDCGCKEKKGDPRWDVLKNFYN